MRVGSVLAMEDQPGSSQGGTGPNGRLIARSEAIHEILGLVRKIAGTGVPVLIQGEIGVGKRAIAREIHHHSRRGAGPFVCVACGSLRESELDEKLFGESRDCLGAGTGRPASLLESSQYGTLLLDGVTQLPLWAQVKLPDALQSSNGRRREDGDAVAAEARVIATTTCDPETAVAQNDFYSGLYYHLGAVRIDIPPLRHRQEDIRALAEYFLGAAVSKLGPPRAELPWRFSEDAWQCLLHHDWPGNTLELAAVVAHAVVFAEGPEIGKACVEGLLGKARRSADCEAISVPLAGGLKEMELAIVNEVIRRCRGNKAAAARTLRLHRRTLYRLLGQ